VVRVEAAGASVGHLSHDDAPRFHAIIATAWPAQSCQPRAGRCLLADGTAAEATVAYRYQDIHRSAPGEMERPRCFPARGPLARGSHRRIAAQRPASTGLRASPLSLSLIPRPAWSASPSGRSLAGRYRCRPRGRDGGPGQAGRGAGCHKAAACAGWTVDLPALSPDLEDPRQRPPRWYDIEDEDCGSPHIRLGCWSYRFVHPL
jgi:hypothetical protein